MWATSSKCVLSVWVSRWVDEGPSLCVLFSVELSVEKSPHSHSLFSWWTTLARRAEGQAAEITAADEACDSRPRPLCLDGYSQHTVLEMQRDKGIDEHGNEWTAVIIKTWLSVLWLLRGNICNCLRVTALWQIRCWPQMWSEMGWKSKDFSAFTFFEWILHEVVFIVSKRIHH